MKELGFIKIQYFDSFDGRVIDTMPKLKESGLELTDFHGLANGRLNANENDRELLRSNYYFLAGVPVIGNKSGEQKYIFNLAETPQIRELIIGLNPNTKLNNSLSLPLDRNSKKANEIYASVKGDHVHIMSLSIVCALRRNAYDPEVNLEEFWEKAFHGDKDLLTKYRGVVKEISKTEKNMGVYPGSFTGLQVLVVGSVGNANSVVYSTNNLSNSNGRLLGGSVGDATKVQSAEGNTQKISNDKIHLVSLEEAIQYGGLQNDFAPNQIAKLQKTFESNGYQIIKQ